MNYIVRTAKSKEFQISHIGSTIIGYTSILYITFIGSDMMNIVSIFSNKEETIDIQSFLDGEKDKEFHGYTKLTEAIIEADTGDLRIALIIPNE